MNYKAILTQSNRPTLLVQAIKCIGGDINNVNIDTQKSPGFQPTNVSLSKEIRENVAELNFHVNNIEESFLNHIYLLNNSTLSLNSVDNDRE